MANVGSLRTTISLDSAQFEQSMSGVNRQLKSLKQEQKAVTSSGTGFARGTEELRQKQDVLNRTFELQKGKVQELKRRYDESSAATGENSRETQQAQTEYNKAVAEMNRTETALKGVTDELNRQTNPWNQVADDLDNTSRKLENAGKKMTDFGKSWSMKVTAPIVGMGAVILNTGMEFEASMSNVQAVSGATGNDLELLEEAAREMGATTTKSASEAADGLGYMALAGWETQEMLDGLEPVLRLSEAGNMNLARASDLVTDSMSALGVEVKDLPAYLDNVAEASRSSNTSIDQLMQAYVTAGGNLNQFNIPLEESTAWLGVMANNGIKGSEAGRGLNAILTNLTSGAGRAGTAMEELNISAFDSEGQFIGLEETLQLVNEATKDMTDEQRAQYVSMIAGKEHMKTFQALMSELDDGYIDLKDNVSDADGALNDMADTMQDNARGNVAQLKSATQELALQFAEHLIPVFTDVINFATNLAQKFGELDDDTQRNIITMAGLAAAIGPVSIVTGNLTRTVGGATRGLSNLTRIIGSGSSTGTLSGGLTGLVGAGGTLALTAGGIGAVAGAGYLLYRHFSTELIPEVDLFGDEVSDTTQQAVGSFMDLNNGATAQLNELAWSGREVSEEMAESLVSTFDEMGSKIVDSLNKQKGESLQAIQELFDGAKNISIEEQADIINSVSVGYEERIRITEEGNNRIEEIMIAASEENRAITEYEQNEINEIRQSMQDTAIETLTETEEEQRIILERMADQSEIISKHQASDVIKNSVEQKEAVIKEAEEQFYNQKVAFENARDVTGDLSEEQADKLILEAERQRDGTIERAEGMHQAVIDEAKKRNPELLNEVSVVTGEIFSEWDKHNMDVIMRSIEMQDEVKGIWNQVKAVFSGNQIDFVKPSIKGWLELENDAKSIWGRVRDIFSSDISMPAPTIREPNVQQRSASMARFEYADGTDYHPGGEFLAGEEGWELGRQGNRWEMLNFGMYNRPAGYQVFTHDESKRILGALNNIPGYATGARPTGEANRVINRLNDYQEPSSQPVVIELHVTSEIDGRVAGQAVERYVTEIQDRNKKVREQFA